MGTGTPFQEPSAACRQEWQTPLAVMRTATSPARGGSSSSSSTTSGLPCSNSTDARMRVSGRVRSAAVADPRVQIPVEQVHEQIEGHEQQGNEEDGALGEG